MNQNSSLFTVGRQEKLAKYHHTDDGYIYSLRAIIKNDQGQIVMMYDERYKTYTVPGGKWEAKDGSRIESLQREVLEEINCHILNIEYIGESKCFRAGGAVCHVYYDVTIAGEPQLSEEHMTSLHWCSYRETDDYLGYDILVDGEKQYLADNILKTLDLFDLVEYRYLLTHPKNHTNWGVVLPDAASIMNHEVYFSVMKDTTLSIILQKERDGQGTIILAQPGEFLLTGIQKVYASI